MADTLTLTYDFTQPEVGGSDDTWGDKLNANWDKLDDLLTATFVSGGSTSTLGTTLRLTGTTPQLQFRETDAVSPDGQFAFQGTGSTFLFVRYTAASFTTPETLWGCTATGSFLVYKPTTIYDNLRIGNTDTTPTVFTLQGTGGFNYIDNYATTGLVFRSSPGAIQNARIDAVGTTAPSALTIMTREKGDARYFMLGASSPITGIPLIESTTPALRFHETDAVSPAGQFEFVGNAAGNFSFYRYTAANFTTPTAIWVYAAATNELISSVPSTFTSSVTVDGAATFGAAVHITNVSPVIYLNETDQTDPAGRFRHIGFNDTYLFQRAASAGWATQKTIWRYTGGASGDFQVDVPFISTGLTKLATTTDGVVEVGGSTQATVKFMRPSVNWLSVPDGQSLRVMNHSGTTWATVSSASGWQAGTSDGRLKENVRDIHYGLDTILALRPVEFDWIAEKRHDIGLIAQEVEPIIPEIVEVWEADPDIEGQIDTYAMRKDALTVVLVKAVQELTARVAVLEGRI